MFDSDLDYYDNLNPEPESPEWTCEPPPEEDFDFEPDDFCTYGRDLK